MDSNRALAFSVPLLIALGGLGFSDSHINHAASPGSAATNSLAATPPSTASKPHSAKVIRRLAVKPVDPRNALNATTLLRFGLVSLSTTTR